MFVPPAVPWQIPIFKHGYYNAFESDDSVGRDETHLLV